MSEDAACPVCQNGRGRMFGAWANCPHGWAGWRAEVERKIDDGFARYESLHGPLPDDVRRQFGRDVQAS